MKEISIQVCTKRLQREKRFSSRLLHKWNCLSEDKHRWLQAKVYQTAKDKLAVEIINSPHSEANLSKGNIITAPEFHENSNFSIKYTNPAVSTLLAASLLAPA